MSSPKNRLVQIYSKSANKNNSKDIYFPALGNKANINFPFEKSLFFKENKKDVKNMPEIKQFKQQHEVNPQTHEETKKNLQQRVSSNSMNQIFKDDKIMVQKAPMHQMNSRMNKSAIYFTKRQLDIFQKSSIEQMEKRNELQSKFMQRRDDFQDFRKKKQMLRNKQKQDLMFDLLTKKSEWLRQQKILQRQRQQQKVFLHQQNLSKIDMQRCLKFRTAKQQLNLTKQKYMQTQDLAHFLKMQQFKSKKNHMNLLQSRLTFLMSNKIKDHSLQQYANERMTSRSFYLGNQMKSNTSRVSKSNSKKEQNL